MSKTKIGIILVVFSFVPWLFIPFVPFLTFLSGSEKVSAAAALTIAAEVLFWGGALLAGKDAARAVRKYANPRNWKKRKTSIEDKMEGSGTSSDKSRSKGDAE
ncbi:transporter suffix domain-containing protein [Fictibacillus iocasae]|uniref:Transporter suffix domain-containing protein n=1 Tax=Fictibacillus iocasae TaxID=2715437 RepID=A0ABW2NRI3_9BACL